jgi:hypothetical protein
MNLHVEPDTDPQMYTLELAQLYEKQGYREDAHRIYAALDALEPTAETQQGMDRTVNDHPMDSSESAHRQTRQKEIMPLLEAWVGLLNAEYQLERLKKFKSPVL